MCYKETHVSFGFRKKVSLHPFRKVPFGTRNLRIFLKQKTRHFLVENQIVKIEL